VGLAADAGRRHAHQAACLACTVKPLREPCADRIAAAVALDMAQWWQPTGPRYLGRVSKTLICEAVTEAKGKAAVDKIATLRKGDMATHAAELLNGSGWLLAMLRAA
jgi:ParB family transcriptional regulator, chromosome partitioning protein